jgi:ATP-dependent DNA helicase PIF1
MILRNLDPPRLCNGTRAVVTHMYRNCIAVRIMTGAARGEIALIPRIPMKAENCYVEFYRRQLPISVAFAIAINKSQGQTLDVVGVDLRESCFSHGQLYVACSRVGRPDNLIILSADRRTKNVVYRPALQGSHAHA